MVAGMTPSTVKAGFVNRVLSAGKSLPATSPPVDADSPMERKDTNYVAWGSVGSTTGRPHWLMRRSNSGAFSNMPSGSDNSATATPEDKGAQASQTRGSPNLGFSGLLW